MNRFRLIDSPPTQDFRNRILATIVAGIACVTVGLAASAEDDLTVFVLQGTEEESFNLGSNHGKTAANYFREDGDETGIYFKASDWVGGHNPEDTEEWPFADGITKWAYWDASAHDGSRRGVEVLTADGRAVFRGPGSDNYAFVDAGSAGPVGFEKLYYLRDYRTIDSLNFGNDGVPAGSPASTADRQQALIAEYKLGQAYDAGFTGANLVSATFSILIDDVIQMETGVDDTTLPVPTRAFVNVFAGDGELTEFESVQGKYGLIDEATAADSRAMVWTHPVQGDLPVSDASLNQAFFRGNTLGFEFDFDVTDEIAALLDEGEDFAGLTLAGTADGAFTLASLDRIEPANYLPWLTLEFAAVTAELAGDYDGDGSVRQADLDLVLGNWGLDFSINGFPETWVNFRDFSGPVAQAQLDAVLGNWGASNAAPSGLTPVPEPATTTLGLICVVGLVSRRRRLDAR